MSKIAVYIMDSIVGKQSRFFWMGLAIIAVILYHLVLFLERIEGEITPPIVKMFFGRGYLGVDIFMFLSVFGLSCSLNKISRHSFGQYLKRRIKRIFPLYLCYLLVVFIVFQQDKSVEEYAKILVFQCTGLSALSISFFSCDAEWFTPALLLVYWVFPCVFVVLNKLHEKVHNQLLLDIVIIVVLAYTLKYWNHLATWNLIIRMPIMYLGYCTWLYMKNGERKGLLILYVVSGCLAYISNLEPQSLFLPLLLMSINALNMRLPNRLYSLISLVGTYSFEVYLGQCVATKYFMQSGWVENVILRLLCAILLTCIFSCLFVYISKLSYARKS